MIKTVVSVGAGNLATQLIKALYRNGVQVLQVYSKTELSASALAKQVGAEPLTQLSALTDTADLYIFAVKDDVLPTVLGSFPHKHKAMVHTAGSVPMDVFLPYANNYGVFYPLQTFSKQRDVDFKQIPICIEANNDALLCELRTLANSLSEDVRMADSTQRKAMHLAAVFVCNFTNHLYHIGHQLMEQHGLDFDILKPLIVETASKVMEAEPKAVQTGPAVRYDTEVMEKHLSLLNHEPALQELYQYISKQIFETHKK